MKGGAKGGAKRCSEGVHYRRRLFALTVRSILPRERSQLLDEHHVHFCQSDWNLHHLTFFYSSEGMTFYPPFSLYPSHPSPTSLHPFALSPFEPFTLLPFQPFALLTLLRYTKATPAVVCFKPVLSLFIRPTWSGALLQGKHNYFFNFAKKYVC